MKRIRLGLFQFQPSLFVDFAAAKWIARRTIWTDRTPNPNGLRSTMRWFWIDQYTEFVSGKHACARKSCSLSEEVVDEYAPGRPFLPSSLIIEGLAQTGGLLVAEQSDFLDRVVLAKVQSSKFHFEVYPGETLLYRVDVQSMDDDSAIVAGTSHRERDGKLQAEINLMFAKLRDERFDNVELFEPAELCRMIRLLRLFEVGVKQDGQRIQVPPHMVAAEKAVLLKGLKH